MSAWKAILERVPWCAELDRETLRADMMAALTGAVVVLPQGVAFAAIAGMPPEYGLYSAMVPAVLAALLGSSRLMMSGPTTPTSIVLFSSLAVLAAPGSPTFVLYALTLTFMVGLLQLLMGLARLGHLVNFVSDSVIRGFSAGAAVLILLSQVKHLLGLDLPSGLSVHQALPAIYERADQIDWMTFEVALLSLVVGIVAKRLIPSVPNMLVAMVAGTLVALAFNRYLLGDVPLITVSASALPPLSVPAFDLTTWQRLAPAAFAMTFFALTQTLSIARSLAARTGDRVDANQEFVAQGVSNLAGSFASSYVSAGSFNRSAVNYQAGARTPLSSVLCATLLVLILLLISPLLAYMPKAATAGVLVLVAVGIVDTAGIRKTLRSSRSDATALTVTFLATVLLTLDFAILLGILVSVVTFFQKASHPRVLVRVPDPRSPKRRFTTTASLPECPQLKMIRIDGSLFFGAANYVGERLRILFKRNPEQRHLLIIARSITTIDTVGAEMLAREARRRQAIGGAVYLHQLNEEATAVLRRGGYLETIGEDHLFDRKGDAIAYVFERLDRRICMRCTRRIFNECKTVPRADAGD